MSKRLQIFRAGKHTATNGLTQDYSEQLLRDAVAAYDPAVHEAPIVVGHPHENLPAYGWINALHFADGGLLEASPCNVDPAFAEMVNAGRFKKISASFYLPDSPDNPKPGSLYLRHVGFLGAQPPAVKGLKSASFAEAEQGIVEFGDWSDSQNASLWRRLREWIISKDGMDEADKVIPDYAVQTLESAARTDATSSINYTEQSESKDMLTPEQIAIKEADLAAREQALQMRAASFSEREQALTAQEQAALRVALVSFADGLITEGKLLPIHKDKVIALMTVLPANTTLEFGEGDGKQTLAPLECFKTFLSALPKQVTFGEHNAAAADANTDTVNFAAPRGYTLDGDGIELHSKALAHQQANPGISYVDAVKAVS